MTKVRQRTQSLSILSCSRHKRYGFTAQTHAALPTMMSGLDGCSRADVTWVGYGEKEGESFHVCFCAAQCWLGTVAELGSAWSASIIYIYIYIYIFFSKVAREDVLVKKSNCTTWIRTRDPSLMISGALPTELWCSCQPRQNRMTVSLEHQTHFSCETTQAGGRQPSTVTHTFHIESTMRGAPMRYILLRFEGFEEMNFFSKVAREDVRVKKSNCTTWIRTRDPSLMISGALPTELWCSCQPRQNRMTVSLEHLFYKLILFCHSTFSSFFESPWYIHNRRECTLACSFWRSKIKIFFKKIRVFYGMLKMANGMMTIV